jgi:heme/copper-type cytochrome/quinol oxidase subunit 3
MFAKAGDLRIAGTNPLVSGSRQREALPMALKAPGILVFLLSVVLALAVLFARYFGAQLPFLTADWMQFYGMLGAYAVLLLGCIMRGL